MGDEHSAKLCQMNINIVCVGKIKENFYRAAVEEYAKRLGRFCKFSVIEVAEEMLSGDNDKQIEIVKTKEGKRILEKCKGMIVVLDLHGKQLSSEEFAECIASNMTSGVSQISFVIGGSYGLSSEVLSYAKMSICFGKMTYPHQLMRVILAEQIYRAFMINEGSVYHK